MRTEVLEYLQQQNLGTFIVSTELPWSESGVPLYTKNLKKIYVDVDQYLNDPIITTLSGLNISLETKAVRVYLANDAKSIPPNYDEVITVIKGAKDINNTDGYNRREADVTTSFDADRLVTEIELRYIKLI
jgi:hypothetical protein